MHQPSKWRNRFSSRNSTFIFNFLGFLIASAGAFLPRNNMLLLGLDGEYARNTTIQLFRFTGSAFSLPMVPFEGMGSLFPFNLLLAPSMVPVLLGDSVGRWLGFLVCAGLVFLSTYALGRALGLPRIVCLLAAWVLPPLCLPYQPWLNLYLRYALEPSNADFVSATMFLLALLGVGYTSRHVIWIALGIALTVFWLFLADPLYIVLLLPTAIPIGIAVVLSRFGEAGFLRKTALFVLPSLVFVGAGGGAYLLGLYSDAAASFFPQEMNRNLAHTWRMCTVATAWNRGIDPLGGAWVGLALFGLALAAYRERGTLRFVAIAVSGSVAFLILYIIAYFMSASWWLPYPIYFELMLWPLYTLFAAYAIAALISFIFNVASTRLPYLTGQIHDSKRSVDLQLFGPLCLGVVLFVLFAVHPFAVRPDTLYRPPTNTEISDKLRDAIGIAPGTPFRGYAANLTGYGGLSGPATDWLGIMGGLNEAIIAFGNSHRLPYLWRYNIPTIETYSEIVEPAIYAVITRLLDRPGDLQVRNITMVTQPNFRVMQSLGVRFLVTDFSLSEPARLTVELTKPGISHSLYELPDVNYGDYSPTEVIVANDAAEVLRRLADRDFNFRKTAILTTPIDVALSPAESSNLTVIRGGWRIRAKSADVSLLLLPIQFSKCLSLHQNQTTAGKVVAIHRANLTSVALIFERTIDVSLSGQVSPFWSAYCRLHDAEDLRKLGIASLPKNVAPMHGALSVN